MHRLKKSARKAAVITAAAFSLAAGLMAVPAGGLAIQAAEYTVEKGQASFAAGPASIVIQANAGQSLMGKTFTLYKLFDAQVAAGGESIHYTWTQEAKPVLQSIVAKALKVDTASVQEHQVIDYIQKLSDAPAGQLASADSNFRYFVEELRTALKNAGVQGQPIAVNSVQSDGSFVIAGLEFGYYVLDETSAVQSEHAASSLCMVSTAAPSASIQIKSDYPELIKKIWEDDNDVAWNDIGDYEIGQDIPYKFETRVPNMTGYDKYYFAFHDKMDAGLDFDPDSVAVEILGDAKTYTLVPGKDFRVETGSGDVTFSAVIDDLKALVEREFGAGAYGQQVLVTFTGRLNEQAADKTGRPGFENHARLEFSNNPDSDDANSTGNTPWDTVVAFTYRIEGSKVNEQGTTLAGACFRLYRDAALSQEVALKKEGGAWVVIHPDADPDAVGEEIVTDASGTFDITGLDQGTYWLKETKAPQGYRPLQDPIEITLAPVFTEDRDSYVPGAGAGEDILQSLEASARLDGLLSGLLSSETLETSVQSGCASLQVVNKTGSRLPMTGSSATIIALAAGTVITLAGVAVGLKSRKKEA